MVFKWAETNGASFRKSAGDKENDLSSGSVNLTHFRVEAKTTPNYAEPFALQRLRGGEEVILGVSRGGLAEF